MNKILLYDFEFKPFENPGSLFEEFEDKVKEFFEANNYDWGMSALGGMAHIRGSIHGESINKEDKKKILDWVQTQPLNFTVKLSDVLDDHEDLQIFREITETVVHIKNLKT